MVHENADAAHVPGHQPVPERDIEPLWPPDPADPGHPWAAPTPPPADAWTPAAATPPASPSPTDPSAAGPRAQQLAPDEPALPAPRAQQPAPDEPVLPEPRAEQPVAPKPALPGPRAGQPAAPVDLDQPFTLDQPATSPSAGTNGRGAGGSPWAQPPQRPTSTEQQPGAPTTAAATVPPAAPHTGDRSGPAASADDERSGGTAGAPQRLGPFPPAPGVPPHPHAPVPGYGDGTAYRPRYGQSGPGGQPAHPGAPTYPAQVETTTADWYPPAWSPGQPATAPVPPQPRVPAPGYPDRAWTPETGATPTAEDFARRRQARPVDPVATMGVRAVVNKLGLVRLAPGRHEQEIRRDIEMVRRNFGGLRQVTVVNPKGGAGKTVAILLLAMTFGQKRGGYVLAWDNNETQGTLGMRAQQDFHSRTVRDLLRDPGQFQGAHGRVGDLSQYVRSQGEGMFDVLASDESATGGEMLTATAFGELREVVSRFYKLIFVDTGNNVRAQNWQAAMDATDQLVVTMSARNDSAETAARMLDHLEQSGRQRLVRQAVTVVSMPPSRKEIDLPAIQQHFAARTRAVLLAPYERLIDTGEPIRYGQLSSATRDAWLKIAAAVAEGL
ncbi:chromosome partitioning protein [Micromonospora globispora]|uniref:Chromosome partitioning protein n=1 Tax=Micromonospora globispora TaxID=1450148 RepID=A0A317KAQ2_9ACTN|nr:chromosome partitioning protein [Micromonospora globispora]PWU50416.1 chromosome partitioning protein [Micromonospora globispora]